MKNVIKGWGTTLLGAVIMIMALLDFYHIIPVPAPDGITEFQQVLFAFIAGLVLLLIPRGKLETLLVGFLNKKTTEDD